MKRIFILSRVFMALIMLACLEVSFAQGLQIYGLRNTNPQSPFSGDLELVKVDPFTGIGTPLYPFPQTLGVALGSSTYDQKGQRYLFWGVDDSGNDRFYNASVDTAAWLSPILQTGRPIELQYDLQADLLYGLLWDDTAQTEYLVTVDLQTGQTQSVSALPGVKFIEVGVSTFNSNDHRFIFIGRDAALQRYLYEVDAINGQILSQALLTDSTYYRGMQYDLTTNQLYALWAVEDTTQGTTPLPSSYFDTYLVTIDLATGQPTLVDSVPLLSGFMTGIQVGSTDFDQATRTLVMVARDDTSDMKLRLIDVSTGQVISSVAFPTVTSELEVDNQVFARQAYGNVTSGPALERGTVEVAPNPFSDRLEVRVTTGQLQGSLHLLDATGRTIFKQSITEVNMSLSLSSQPAGMYWLRITSVDGATETLQVVKQ